MIGRRIRATLRDQRGYTLIELVVSSTIFILLAVVVVGVLVSVSQSSSKTAAQRKVQQDVRVNIEEVARTVRTSKIDYAFYRENAGDARCRLPGDATGSRALSLLQTKAGQAD
ncbi:MAG: prepilin-type N-terminal cleavage/methylation domain-containing protein, partial [bacterium]|nr:prepilin-type N-terminal cleavage/methylation domain-containing protein [bacterium]